MRRAAGILMVIFGMTAMGIFVYGIQDYYGLAFNLLMIFSTVFIITGGVFCLKRKYWIVCFISSLLLPCFVFLLWTWVIPSDLGLFFIGGGIISVIFVGLRRREWHEFSV
jgi:hypothetical protein